MTVPITEGIPEILRRFESTPPLRRLKVRVRELGANARDEVAQFKLLQRACKESPDLAAAFANAGYGDVTALDLRHLDAATGAMVQAFNKFIEARWAE